MSTRDAISAAGTFLAFQPVGHVFGDGVVREDRVVLKHHAGVAAMRGQSIDAPTVEANGAGFDIDEACDHAQQRRLPTA
ncbi:hypothetical protein ABIF64_007510 [Bradyrhizobium japonicum]